MSIWVFCYQYSLSISSSNDLQFHKNIWSESKEPRTKHVGKKGVQTWSFFKKDSVSFWTILCEPLLNNLIPTSLSHEWLLVLYLGLLPIHQLMSQQKQHFSLAFLLNISFFWRRNSCKWLSCLSRKKSRKNNCPKRICSWYWCGKTKIFWAKWGAIPEKSHTGIMRVGGWGYGIPRGVIQETAYQIPGFIKKGVEFTGIKKNACGICIGAWFLALDLGISKQQCNTVLWNFQGWSFAFSEIFKGEVTIS